MLNHCGNSQSGMKPKPQLGTSMIGFYHSTSYLAQVIEVNSHDFNSALFSTQIPLNSTHKCGKKTQKTILVSQASKITFNNNQ